MKRFIGAFFAFLVLFGLSSCKKADERFFDYQDDIKSVSGTYTEDGVEYEVTLYFERTEEKRACRRIEYSAPESLEGISFTLEGDKITAELSGIRIAYSYFEEEKVFCISRLFSLSEEDIYDIKGAGEKTKAMGKNKDCVWQVETNKEGMPVEITYEDNCAAVAFEVKEIQTFQENNGTN